MQLREDIRLSQLFSMIMNHLAHWNSLLIILYDLAPDIKWNATDVDVRVFVDSFNISWPVSAACMEFSCFEMHGPTYCASAWRCELQVGKPSRSKHNVLPRGSLQFKSLTKEDHGEWECVATNVATSITASTHVQVIGTQHVHKHTYAVCI